jgi:glycosyltransferase involved in cell wall biosynthesis
LNGLAIEAMRKVLIISYYWPPSGGAGVQRWLKTAKYLPEFGIEPVILTVDEKTASYPVIDRSLELDVPPGLKVIRTKSFEPLNFYKTINPKGEMPHSGFVNEANPGLFQKISRFIRGNCFIPDARKGWNKFALKEAIRIIEQEKIQTVLISSPPHSSQLIGLELKKLTGIHWIADFRDPWTDIYYYRQMNHLPFASRRDARLEKRVLEKADAVMVVGESLKNLLQAKVDKSYENKFHIIPNGYDEDDFKDFRPDKPTDGFVITYTGTLTTDYSPGGFIKALGRFVKEGPKDIRLRFVGQVSEELIPMVKHEIPSENIEFTGVVSHIRSVAYLEDTALLFLAIPRIQNNEGILTGKLFEYLGSGKSILCVGPEKGDAARIISNTAAGRCFAYEDVDGIRRFIEDSYRQWIENGKVAVRKNVEKSRYSRRNLAGEIAGILLKEQQSIDKPPEP